ncbi:GDSL-type esterase/lipase family protein [Luethyella okanaganae]|uniref:GDSL-type esterase/lipase family protein n=1 Tax=Luethyella okanaganae TaxID=69372 RepID=A0ABW1VHB0_9MICO
MSISIAFVGDSLTASGRWQDWFPEFEAHNHGVGGDTTADVIDRLDRVVEVQPDVIALLVGTNDLAWHKSVEHVVRNIETILVLLRKALPNARILVHSVLPREAEFAPAIRDINRHLRQFAPTIHAQFLDLWPALAHEDGRLRPELTDDGLHLVESGYEAWLAELRPALEVLCSTPPSSRPIELPFASQS